MPRRGTVHESGGGLAGRRGFHSFPQPLSLRRSLAVVVVAAAAAAVKPEIRLHSKFEFN